MSVFLLPLLCTSSAWACARSDLVSGKQANTPHSHERQLFTHNPLQGLVGVDHTRTAVPAMGSTETDGREKLDLVPHPQT